MSGINKTKLIRAVRSWVIVNDDPNAPAHSVTNFDPNALTGGWVSIGHTPKDQPVKITTNGGEVTLVDTAAADGVDAITTPKNYVFDFDSLQFEVSNFDLAYNGSWNPLTKEYSVPTNSSPLQKAAMVVIRTANGKHIYYRGYGTIAAGDAPTLSFTELSKLPLKVTLMGDAGGYAFHIGGEGIESAAGVNPPAGGGALVDATADPVVMGGEISDISLLTGGSGYTVAPDVVITGTGIGATAVATVSGGVVTDVAVTAYGSGYDETTTVTFARN